MPALKSTKLSMPKLQIPKRDRGGVPRSQTERLWLIGGGMIAFVLFLIGYFFFISPQRSETSDVKSQVAVENQKNALLQARIDTLREQNKDMQKYAQQLAKARLALPATSGISDFLRTLQALGNATLTNVTSLSVGEPTDVSAVTAAQPATQNPTATSTAAPAQNTTAPGATTPSAATVYAMPINATVTGTPGGLEKFLEQMQTVQPRAVLITNINESTGIPVGGKPGSTTGKTTLNLTLYAFVSPNTTQQGVSSSAGAHP
jgi:hypothetical protein